MTSFLEHHFQLHKLLYHRIFVIHLSYNLIRNVQKFSEILSIFEFKLFLLCPLKETYESFVL